MDKQWPRSPNGHRLDKHWRRSPTEQALAPLAKSTGGQASQHTSCREACILVDVYLLRVVQGPTHGSDRLLLIALHNETDGQRIALSYVFEQKNGESIGRDERQIKITGHRVGKLPWGKARRVLCDVRSAAARHHGT